MQDYRLKLIKKYGSGEDDHEWHLNFESQKKVKIMLTDFYPFKIKYSELKIDNHYTVEYALYFRLFKQHKSIPETNENEIYKLKYIGNLMFTYEDLIFEQSNVNAGVKTDDGFLLVEGEDYYTNNFFNGIVKSISKSTD
jgi:hypothetical protein